MENGFKVWTFSGIQLVEQPTEKFKQLLWRPRPATLLSKEEQKDVRRRLREYSREFDEIDKEMEEGAAKEVIEARKRLYMEWYTWVLQEKEEVQAEREEMGKPDPEVELALMKTKSVDADEEEKVLEVQEEEVIEETEEVVV